MKNDFLKCAWYIFIAVIFGLFSIFMTIYSWNHPEKTDRQIYIDLWNGKVVRYFTD